MSATKAVSAKAEILGVLAEARAALATALAKLDGHKGMEASGVRSCISMCDSQLAQNEAWTTAQPEEGFNVR